MHPVALIVVTRGALLPVQITVGLGYFLYPSIVHGVMSIIAKQLEFSFSELYCVIEMAEVGASAPSTPGQVEIVDLTHTKENFQE